MFWFSLQIIQQLDGLPEEYKSMFCDVVNARRNDIRQQLLADSHGISHSVMTDFDWKLKVKCLFYILLCMSQDILSQGIPTKSGKLD